eukprot:10146938-Alexandrium_andersonii.AAC.1
MGRVPPCCLTLRAADTGTPVARLKSRHCLSNSRHAEGRLTASGPWTFPARHCGLSHSCPLTKSGHT